MKRKLLIAWGHVKGGFVTRVNGRSYHPQTLRRERHLPFGLLLGNIGNQAMIFYFTQILAAFPENFVTLKAPDMTAITGKHVIVPDPPEILSVPGDQKFVLHRMPPRRGRINLVLFVGVANSRSTSPADHCHLCGPP